MLKGWLLKEPLKEPAHNSQSKKDMHPRLKIRNRLTENRSRPFREAANKRSSENDRKRS